MEHYIPKENIHKKLTEIKAKKTQDTKRLT